MSDGINQKSIARIYRKEPEQPSSAKTVVGMGFVITERHVLTCAHVIESALGEKGSNLAESPNDEIQLDFPFAEQADASYLSRSGRVVDWCPVNDVREADIALLRLDEPLPSSVQPAKLSTVPTSNWRAFGIPAQDGYWSAGTFRGTNTRGWQQLNITAEDAKILEGFSGTPVWAESESVVIGMVVARMSGIGYQPAFMLPVELLQRSIRIADVDTLFDYLSPFADSLWAPIKSAYAQCLPEIWDEPEPTNLRPLLRTLGQDCSDEAGESGASYSALARFAAILLEAPSSVPEVNDRLATWLAQKIEDVPALLTFVRERQPNIVDASSQSSLLFQVSLSQGTDLKKYRVDSWLVSDPSKYSAQESQGCYQLDVGEDADQTFNRDEIPGLVQLCLEQAACKYRVNDPTLEIFLPLSWLNESVEDWTLAEDDEDPFGTDPEKIGWSYRVVLRSSDRVGWPYKTRGKSALKMQHWRERWKQAEEKLKTGCRTCDVLLDGNDPAEQRSLTQRLATLEAFGIHFSQPPSVEKGGDIATTLGMAMPISIWLRQAIPDARNALNAFLEGRLNELLEDAKQQRNQGCNPGADLGCHLAVLWDNPNLLPPFEREVS